jgi:DNA-directed RNA polymerase subunit RPC12/RpoP
MVISSRTPESQPNCCPVCGKAVVMEPSQPFGDAPCPHCGCLLRFEPLGEGIRVSVAQPASTGAEAGGAGFMYVCPQCKTRFPFGTETKPPPTRCPRCERRLWIPTTLMKLPGGLAPKASG